MNAREVVDQPRVPLAQLPTPLQPTNWAWGRNKLWVKRDDLTGASLTGNKVRKLEYLLADAVQQGCDTVVTCGGIQSNHARATAIAARSIGLNSVLVLAGEAPEEVDGNLLLGRMVGADVRILEPMSSATRMAATERIAEELRQSGAKGRTGSRPYVIPSGGSDEVGVLGYIRAAEELARDLASSGAEIDTIVVPVGSGGTYAGLFLGSKLFGIPARIVGATVADTVDAWKSDLDEYISRCIAHWSLDVSYRADEIELIDAAGQGYAQSTPAELEFIVDFAGQTGLLLDPVYTGKAMFALDRGLRLGSIEAAGDVLFIHTGGVFGLFPKKTLLADALRRTDRG